MSEYRRPVTANASQRFAASRREQRCSMFKPIVETQKAGGVAAFIKPPWDRGGFDLDEARRCGVRVSELLVSHPDTGDQAMEIIDTLARARSIDVIMYGETPLVPKWNW